MEDVTNILKTYVIGERADEHLPIPDSILEETEAPLPQIEDHEAPPPPIDEMPKIERIYVDQLEFEEEEKTMEKAEIHLKAQGATLEGESTLRRMRRIESESSINSDRAQCSHVFADCEVVKKEDSSTFIVTVALPRTIEIICEMRRARKKKREERVKIESEKEGRIYEGETVIRRERRLETSDSIEMEEAKEERREEERIEEIKEIERSKKIEVKIEEERREEEKVQVMERVEIREERIEMKEEKKEEKEEKAMAMEVKIEERKEMKEREAEGGEYHLHTEGMELRGEVRMGGRRKTFESESSEEIEREREAEGGQYSIHQEGLHLQGEMRMKRMKRFDSVSSADSSIYGGGPTIVDLTREESHSHFEAIIEIPNRSDSLLFKLRERRMKATQPIVQVTQQILSDEVRMKMDIKEKREVHVIETSEEHATLSAGLQRTESSSHLKEETMKERRVERTGQNLIESGEEHSMNVVLLENRERIEDESAKILPQVRTAGEKARMAEYSNESTTLSACLQTETASSSSASKEVHTSRKEISSHETKASSQSSTATHSALNKTSDSFAVIGRAKVHIIIIILSEYEKNNILWMISRIVETFLRFLDIR